MCCTMGPVIGVWFSSSIQTVFVSPLMAGFPQPLLRGAVILPKDMRWRLSASRPQQVALMLPVLEAYQADSPVQSSLTNLRCAWSTWGRLVDLLHAGWLGPLCLLSPSASPFGTGYWQGPGIGSQKQAEGGGMV